MTNFNTHQAGFRSQPHPTGFMIEKVALGHIFLRVNGFPLYIINPPLLHFFFHGATAPSGPRLPHYRGFTITLRHNTVGRTPRGE